MNRVWFGIEDVLTFEKFDLWNQIFWYNKPPNYFFINQNWFSTIVKSIASMNNNCLKELFQFSILKNKNVLFLKKIFFKP